MGRPRAVEAGSSGPEPVGHAGLDQAPEDETGVLGGEAGPCREVGRAQLAAVAQQLAQEADVSLAAQDGGERVAEHALASGWRRQRRSFVTLMHLP